MVELLGSLDGDAAGRTGCWCAATASTCRRRASLRVRCRARGRGCARSTWPRRPDGVAFRPSRGPDRRAAGRAGRAQRRQRLRRGARVLDGPGVPLARRRAALGPFAGAGRRFERVGERDGIRVVDDYAHHPARARGHARGRARQAPGARARRLLPAAHAVAHAAVRRRASPTALRWRRRRCVLSRSTSRAAPPSPTRRRRARRPSCPPAGTRLPGRLDAELRRGGAAGSRARVRRRRPRADAAAPARSTRVARGASGWHERRRRLSRGRPARAADDDRHRRAGALLRAAGATPELAELLWPGPTPRSSPSPSSASARTCSSPTTGFDGLALRLEGALAAIEIEGTTCAAAAAPRWRRSSGARPTPALVGHRVRLRDPRHRRAARCA